MAALPFGKSSLRVRRAGEAREAGPTTSSSSLFSTAAAAVKQPTVPESEGERGPREEFLRGHRHKPYSVRRMEMVVGDRGRRVDLDYVERLLTSSPPPSLFSLPTPAQLCRKSKNGGQSGSERQERKRTVAMREDYKNDVHEHLVNLHRKQRLCEIDSASMSVSAQEVPSSPNQDLPAEETSFTLHSKTPLKDPFMTRGVGVRLPFWKEREETLEGEGLGGGQWMARGQRPPLFTSALEQEQGQEKSQSGIEGEFGMFRHHNMGQGLDSCAGRGVRGSELSREEGEEGRYARGRRPGFGAAGEAEGRRMWLAHSNSQGQVWGGRARREPPPLGKRQGGLKIHLPVEEYFEGVPFNRAESQSRPVDQKCSEGFSELHRRPLALSPATPQDLDGRQRTLDHMMELCFNPHTLTLRNHFPREE